MNQLPAADSASPPGATPTLRADGTEARCVLLEVEGDLGTLLWQSLQDVLAWAAAPEQGRVRLFPRGAERIRRGRLARLHLEPEAEVALSTLVELTGAPDAGCPRRVAHACLVIARSLCARGSAASALAFARAATLACPTEPLPPLEVARLLGPGRTPETRAWLLHALRLADGRHANALRAEVLAELAVLHFREGAPNEALGHLTAALRSGRTAGGTP